jgi:hypothetical protein
MYHLYHDNTYQRPGIPPGAGNHPSDQWLNAHGYHRVAQQPPAPASGMVWQAATPPYALVDGVSTPQGAWVIDDNPPPQRYSKLRLYDELTALGMWDTFETTLTQHGKWRAFDLAQDLSSDHPDFMATKELLIGMLNVDAEAILEACVLD